MTAVNRPIPILKQGFQLYDYQKRVIEWLAKREQENPKNNYDICGGLICLTMGLGKTLIALEHSLRSQTKYAEQFPTLIITSKTVMHEWKIQGVEKFYNNIRVLYFHKDFIGNSIKTIFGEQIMHYNLVITTYDQCLQIARKFDIHDLVCEYGEEGIHTGKIIAIHTRKRPKYNPNTIGLLNIYQMPWKRIICDESQRFANHNTYTFKAMMALYGEYKWCLTGTPIRNKDTDIWSQFRWCGFNDITHARFWTKYSYEKYQLHKYLYETNYVKENVDIPELKITYHNVDMDTKQKEIYTTVLTDLQNAFQQMLQKFITYAAVLAMLLRLRQICIAPHVITKNKDTTVKYDTNLDSWILDEYGSAGIDSPKIRKIISIMRNIPQEEKIIVFSMFTSCLKMLELAIRIDISTDCYEYIDGGVTGHARMNSLQSFSTDPRKRILLIHYKVGGEGLNITCANHIICIEPWWSPAVHSQAIARAWRTGQTKPVNVHWVITNSTIEVQILQICENKQKLSDYYLYNKEFVPVKTGLNKYELQKLLYNQ